MSFKIYFTADEQTVRWKARQRAVNDSIPPPLYTINKKKKKRTNS